MRGFHKVYGANWLRDGEEWLTIYATDGVKRVSTYKSRLPEHWNDVKQILLLKNN